jgi:hypothetical protein
MRNYFSIFILIFSLSSCSNTKEVNTEKSMKLTDSKTTSCQLVEKAFTNKGGKVTAHKELYLRCSIQDYFIKICESSVTAEQLRPYINTGIEVEMEIKNGMLDHCNDDPAYAQSRTGTYIIIKRIIK